MIVFALIQMRDEWDAFPLYYACYGGHLEIVKLLINHGARCQPGTFDGERSAADDEGSPPRVSSTFLSLSLSRSSLRVFLLPPP